MKEKYCLASTLSFKQLNQQPTNTSPTRQTFAFAKSPRFTPISTTCPNNTYGGYYMHKNLIGGAIGKSTRSDFTKCTTVSPAVTRYSPHGFLQLNKMHNRGVSLGRGRQTVIHNSYINKQTSKVPASSFYNNFIDDFPKAPMYSMRGKPALVDKRMTLLCQNNNPGPGSYKEMNPQTEHKFLSTVHKISYGTDKSPRFGDSRIVSANEGTDVPGPGQYNELDSLSKLGSYVQSKHPKTIVSRFESAKKISHFEALVKKNWDKLGPGCYRVPSEFGQYDGDVYRQQSCERRHARK